MDYTLRTHPGLRHLSLVYILLAVTVIAIGWWWESWMLAIALCAVFASVAGAYRYLTFRARIKKNKALIDQYMVRLMPHLIDTSSSLSDLSDSIVGTSQTQATRVSEVSSSIEELSASVEEVAAHTKNVSESAASMAENADQGLLRSQEAVNAIQRVSQSVERSTEVIDKLNKAQHQIGKVISVISSIANEINLLSLNATIEAARVGQIGSGFAVVAGEVRSLAKRTTLATKDIGQMIKGITSEISIAAETLQTVTDEIKSGFQLVNEAGKSFGGIRNQANDVRMQIAQISQATDQQCITTAELSRATEAVASSTQTAANDAAEIAQVSQQLWTISDELRSGYGGKIEISKLKQGSTWVLPMRSFLKPESATAVGLIRMADEIEQKSNGRIKIEREFNSGMTNHEAFKRLRRNELAFTHMPTTALTSFVPEIQALDLPYFFSSQDDYNRIVDGVLGKRISQSMIKNRVYCLGFLQHGARHFTNNLRPIRHPKDLQGLKVRITESNIYRALCHALDAIPVSLSFQNLMDALRRNEVDAQENTLETLFQFGIFRYQRYLMLDAHVYSSQVLLASQGILDALPEDLRDIVRQAAEGVIYYQRRIASQIEAQALASMRAEGIKVEELNYNEKQALISLARPIWSQFTKSIGEEVMYQLEDELGHPAGTSAASN